MGLTLTLTSSWNQKQSFPLARARLSSCQLAGPPTTVRMLAGLLSFFSSASFYTADDEKKLVRLAEELKEAQKQAEDADKMYDETQKKMMETERNLEVSDERASVGEFKIIELEEELKVVANNLRSLE